MRKGLCLVPALMPHQNVSRDLHLGDERIELGNPFMASILLCICMHLDSASIIKH